MSGSIGAVSSAALEGAAAAAELCIGICGAVCLWSGIMELMRRSGLASILSRLLSPFWCFSSLRRLRTVRPLMPFRRISLPIAWFR
jgi:spore maturation protein SpmA